MSLLGLGDDSEQNIEQPKTDILSVAALTVSAEVIPLFQFLHHSELCLPLFGFFVICHLVLTPLVSSPRVSETQEHTLSFTCSSPLLVSSPHLLCSSPPA